MITSPEFEIMNNHKHFIESVNNNLRETIDLAAQDYTAVNSLLREYFLRVEEVPVEIQPKMESMIRKLQYMDIFNQRVEHLITIHEKMMTTSMAHQFEESFFHLHIFQSMTIELDLLQSISSIKSTLLQLKKHLVTKSKPSIESYFERTNSIKNILQKTVFAFTEESGDVMHLAIPPLTQEQITLLNNMYTMESERIVLAWFLQSMPTGTREELLHHYENAIKQFETDNTELF